MSKQIVVRSQPPYKVHRQEGGFNYFNGDEQLKYALEHGYTVKFANKVIVNNKEYLEYILEGDEA